MADRKVEEVLARMRAGVVTGVGDGPVVAVRRTWLEARRFSVLAGAEVRLEGGVREVVIKIPRLPSGASEAKARRAHARLRQEHDVPAMLRAVGHGSADVGVVRPLAFLDDIPAFVMERSLGQPLLRVLAEGVRWYRSGPALDDAAARCAAAGRWLAAFQARTARRGDRLDLGEIWLFIDDRVERLARLGALGRDGGRVRSAVRRYFEETAAWVGEGERTVTGVHGDFSLSNVLSTGTDMVVIDFSMFQTGSPVRDASRFYHQLALLGRKPAFRPPAIARLQSAFLEAWTDRWTSRSALFRLCLLQHGVSHWLGLLKSDGRRSLRARLVDGWGARLDRRDVERLVGGRR